VSVVVVSLRVCLSIDTNKELGPVILLHSSDAVDHTLLQKLKQSCLRRSKSFIGTHRYSAARKKWLQEAIVNVVVICSDSAGLVLFELWVMLATASSLRHLPELFTKGFRLVWLRPP
jgi:hypothetical protein